MKSTRPRSTFRPKIDFFPWNALYSSKWQFTENSWFHVILVKQSWEWRPANSTLMVSHSRIFSFFCLSDFTWNHFLSFWCPKSTILTILVNFYIWGFSTISSVIFPKKSKFKASKKFELQFLTVWKQLELISRKIRVAGKLLNVHTHTLLIQQCWNYRKPLHFLQNKSIFLTLISRNIFLMEIIGIAQCGKTRNSLSP